jgi:hypothetical protein
MTATLLPSERGREGTMQTLLVNHVDCTAAELARALSEEAAANKAVAVSIRKYLASPTCETSVNYHQQLAVLNELREHRERLYGSFKDAMSDLQGHIEGVRHASSSP